MNIFKTISVTLSLIICSQSCFANEGYTSQTPAQAQDSYTFAFDNSNEIVIVEMSRDQQQEVQGEFLPALAFPIILGGISSGINHYLTNNRKIDTKSFIFEVSGGMIAAALSGGASNALTWGKMLKYVGAGVATSQAYNRAQNYIHQK